MTKFLVRADASERVLADGRVMVPREPFELSDEDQKDPHNARLIKDELIVEVSTTSAPKKTKEKKEGGDT